MKIEIALSYFIKITPKRYKDLVRVFYHIEDIWQADAIALRSTGWDDELIQEFLTWKNSFDQHKAQAILEKENIECITIDDERYPPLLKEIYDPPFCLFVRGNLEPLKFPLAVVGTRKATPYGNQITELLVKPLAQAGVCIVSGLALGIDGLAHQATLDVKGRTVAVLGGGVDSKTIQPTRHTKLAEHIIANGGAVISEYPPGTEPFAYSFPRRNRIIAGMTLGTLVIEAGDASGTLITAQCALDGNRDVFAVPQNITSPTSIGTNNLLKMGARLVTSAQDILDVLGVAQKKGTDAWSSRPPDSQEREIKITADSKEEKILLPLLSLEPVHIDDIIKNSLLESRVVTSTLTLMEIKGKVKNLGGMMYVLST